MVDVAAGLGQTLGVREVRPEDEVVDAHHVDDLVDVVLVEGSDPDVALELLDGVAVELLGHLRLTDQLAERLALRVADAEVLLLGAGPGHHLEGGVRDVVADHSTDGDLRPTPHLDVVDGALVPVGKVASERIPRLVQVVVGVEDQEVTLTGHGRHGRRFLTPTSISTGTMAAQAADQVLSPNVGVIIREPELLQGGP